MPVGAVDVNRVTMCLWMGDTRTIVVVPIAAWKPQPVGVILMNLSIWIIVAATVAVPTAVDDVCKKRTPKQTDCLCDILYSRFIRGGKKAPTNTVTAAIELLSSSGRLNGYWRIILGELRKGNRSERRCVTVLGKMLALNAQARAILALPEEERERVAMMPSLALDLDLEVVPELLKRAQEADRFLLDFYAVALTRARDRRAIDFLAGILSPLERPFRLPSTRFHAAVGLAQLGDKRGVKWLIDHLDENTSVFNAWPSGVADYNLGTCCAGTLLSLTQQTNLSSKAAWRAWWDNAQDSFSPKYSVVLVDR